MVFSGLNCRRECQCRERQAYHEALRAGISSPLRCFILAHGVKRVIYTSSGAVYGESLYRLTRLYEESPALPLTLYAITKFAAERVCARMSELWQTEVVCARLGTVIGPWERDTGVRDSYGTHTQLAALAVAGKPAVLTQREVRRDWVYSRDVAAGLVALIDARARRQGTKKPPAWAGGKQGRDGTLLGGN